MTISDRALKALKELGLTEYETSAYLAVVEYGPLPASEISAKSSVPYSRIYDVLGRLEEKGFIQIQKGRPTIYRAKAPGEVVRLVRLSWEEKIDTASKVVTDELQPLFEKETGATTRDVWLLHGRAAILAKALEMLDAAREEIIVTLPGLSTKTSDFLPIIDRFLDVKASKVKILTSSVDPDLLEVIPKIFEIRTRERVFGVGIVVDGRQTLIMLAAGESEEEYIGVFSSHAVFAAMAQAYFSSMWNESSPL
ncbi:MAG: TrmB family transcriptional regulator [Candidatus Thorarchaeota archaeon]|nr:TrmB family transcriptional regulator [Candidatus Thorarchaeota archaeon]